MSAVKKKKKKKKPTTGRGENDNGEKYWSDSRLEMILRTEVSRTALCLGIKVVSRAKREKTAAYTIQVSLSIRHKTSTKKKKKKMQNVEI